MYKHEMVVRANAWVNGAPLQMELLFNSDELTWLEHDLNEHVARGSAEVKARLAAASLWSVDPLMVTTTSQSCSLSWVPIETLSIGHVVAWSVDSMLPVGKLILARPISAVVWYGHTVLVSFLDGEEVRYSVGSHVRVAWAGSWTDIRIEHPANNAFLDHALSPEVSDPYTDRLPPYLAQEVAAAREHNALAPPPPPPLPSIFASL